MVPAVVPYKGSVWLLEMGTGLRRLWALHFQQCGACIFAKNLFVSKFRSESLWQGNPSSWIQLLNVSCFGAAANGHEHEHLAAFKPMLSFRHEMPDKPGMDGSVWTLPCAREQQLLLCPPTFLVVAPVVGAPLAAEICFSLKCIHASYLLLYFLGQLYS